jgi:hypothetical protein
MGRRSKPFKTALICPNPDCDSEKGEAEWEENENSVYHGEGTKLLSISPGFKAIGTSIFCGTCNSRLLT